MGVLRRAGCGVLAAIVACVWLAGCGKREPAAAASPSPAAPSTDESPRKTACELLDAARLSAIAGAQFTATGDEGGGSSTCEYQVANGLPYAQLKIEWGGGVMAIAAMGAFDQREPGVMNPLAGLGDEAVRAGPAYMIRVGEDLLQLTLSGIDADVDVAKQIVAAVRPGMGASAAPSAGDDDGDAAAVMAAVSAMVDRAQQAPTTAATPRGESRAYLDKPDTQPFAGEYHGIPLVAGLTLFAAEYEPGRGDYEPITTITQVTKEKVATNFTANLPEGARISVPRDVLRGDLQSARVSDGWYTPGDARVLPGRTSYSISTAIFDELKKTGEASISTIDHEEDSLLALAQRINAKARATTEPRKGTLTRIAAQPVAFPLLLNDSPVTVPAIYVRAQYEGATGELHILDDRDNPIVLRSSGSAVGRIVRIALPMPRAASLEERLQDEKRVELHGIYFDFGKDTLRPESEPVLRELAAALARHPEWQIGIEGHTDNIGEDASNLDLSKRRAAAVKKSLTEARGVSAANLTTAGFGATRPSDSNDTLSGRARNRRVELVRQ